MASTATKVAFTLTAAAAAYLVMADITESEPGTKRKRTNSDVDEGPKADPHGRVEPEESWAARWETNSDRVIEMCRSSSDVKTYGQAIVCMLDETFPEAAPWTGDASTWPEWMYAARDQVKEDVDTLVMDETESYAVTGWQFQVWLMYEREAPACLSTFKNDTDAVVECLARKMYPSDDFVWPPQTDGWQAEFWDYLRERLKPAFEDAGV